LPAPDPASAATDRQAAAYDRTLEAVRSDPDVVGAILVGSRAMGEPFERPASDWDLRLIVRDEAYADVVARLATPHGSPVEVAVIRLSTFERLTYPDSPLAWDRPSYLHCQLALDRLDGRIAALVESLQHLTPSEARAVAGSRLDDYVNAYFRSLKNAAIGLSVESHLDAAESIPPLLTALFALHGRVRPFNRHLGFDLERQPLGRGWLAAAALLPRLEEILATGSTDLQASLFRDVEALARRKHLGDVIDGWEPDVESLRTGRR
jgi:predicted nucleotidyltransferase